jgi:hypothetical protein
MAQPKQSEPGLSVDRRQLLAGTAAVTAAGIVPNAEADGATNLADAGSAATIPALETPALNFCASTARKMKKIVARNRIRQEAGLPLLSVPQELRRMKQVTDAMAFEDFADRDRQAFWNEVLGPVRETRGEPNWYPSRFLDGLLYQSRVSRILRERFKVAQTSPNKSG